jgi:hypothetical protein
MYFKLELQGMANNHSSLQLQLCGTNFRTLLELKTVSTTLKVWFSPGMAQYVVVLHADNIFSFLFYF